MKKTLKKVWALTAFSVMALGTTIAVPLALTSCSSKTTEVTKPDTNNSGNPQNPSQPSPEKPTTPNPDNSKPSQPVNPSPDHQGDQPSADSNKPITKPEQTPEDKPTIPSPEVPVNNLKVSLEVPQVTVNKPVTLTANVTNADVKNCFFTWYYNTNGKWTLINNVTTQTLTIPAKDVTNSLATAEFIVSVTEKSTGNQASSEPVKISVQQVNPEDNWFSVTLSTTPVKENTTATITANVSDISLDQCEFQWSYSQNGTDWTAINGATKQTLTVASQYVTETNKGVQFRVKVTNKQTLWNVTTQPISLNIEQTTVTPPEHQETTPPSGQGSENQGQGDDSDVVPPQPVPPKPEVPEKPVVPPVKPSPEPEKPVTPSPEKPNGSDTQKPGGSEDNNQQNNGQTGQENGNQSQDQNHQVPPTEGNGDSGQGSGNQDNNGDGQQNDQPVDPNPDKNDGTTTTPPSVQPQPEPVPPSKPVGQGNLPTSANSALERWVQFEQNVTSKKWTTEYLLKNVTPNPNVGSDSDSHVVPVSDNYLASEDMISDYCNYMGIPRMTVKNIYVTLSIGSTDAGVPENVLENNNIIYLVLSVVLTNGKEGYGGIVPTASHKMKASVTNESFANFAKTIANVKMDITGKHTSCGLLPILYPSFYEGLSKWTPMFNSLFNLNLPSSTENDLELGKQMFLWMFINLNFNLSKIINPDTTKTLSISCQLPKTLFNCQPGTITLEDGSTITIYNNDSHQNPDFPDGTSLQVQMTINNCNGWNVTPSAYTTKQEQAKELTNFENEVTSKIWTVDYFKNNGMSWAPDIPKYGQDRVVNCSAEVQQAFCKYFNINPNNLKSLTMQLFTNNTKPNTTGKVWVQLNCDIKATDGKPDITGSFVVPTAINLFECNVTETSFENVCNFINQDCASTVSNKDATLNLTDWDNPSDITVIVSHQMPDLLNFPYRYLAKYNGSINLSEFINSKGQNKTLSATVILPGTIFKAKEVSLKLANGSSLSVSYDKTTGNYVLNMTITNLTNWSYSAE